MKKSFALLLFIAFANSSFGQSICLQNVTGGNCSALNPITTAVPFLTIGPDSRSGAMGDAGVALSADANSEFWNAAKLPFADKKSELALSYSPWLHKLVPDMSLTYLSGYTKVGKTGAVGGSLRYFTLGNITFTDNNGNTIRDFSPNEFALDASYSMLFSDKFSGSLTGRYINSNLTGGTSVGGADSKAGSAFAVDLGAYYRNKDFTVSGKKSILALGLQISNIGNKISYTNNSQQDFLPTNLKLGGALTIKLDEYNQLTFTYDANKLLVPTPPIYNPNDATQIISGKNPNVDVVQGILQSFADAPGTVVRDSQGNIEYTSSDSTTAVVQKGSKFREELHEINHAFGLEYLYADQFAVRTGYYYESASKGNRKYFTIGLGVRYSVFGLDISYLIPSQPNNPLANTIRFTLRLRFDNTQTQAKSSD